MEFDWRNIFVKYKKDILFYFMSGLVVVLFINVMIFHNTIIEKQDSINILNTELSNQSKENEEMASEIAELTKKNNELEKQIEEYQEEIKNYKKDAQKASQTVSKNFGAFKSYTNYKCLSRSSAQWKLQERAYTDSNGLRKIGDAYLVAMGSYYGTTLGTRYTVTLSNGNTLQVMLCDFKKDIHTDSKHQVTTSDGSVLEFYVDGDKLSSNVKRLGTVSAIPFFNGSIVSIAK